MPVYAIGDRTPVVHPDAFVHPDAVLIGDVLIGADATVWPGAVLRGDYGRIEVGARTSVQDGTVVHATAELPTIIGSDCVVGHIAHLEGCTVEPFALVGSGSVVLHRAVIRSHSLVGANAVVPNGFEVPSFAMAIGVPVSLRLDVMAEGYLQDSVDTYVENGRRYRTGLRLVG